MCESCIFEYCRLLDVCDVYQPYTVATQHFVADGKYAVYGANGIIGKYDKYNHENSEIVMACRGASCGVLNITKPKSWINGNAMVIHPNGTVVLKQSYLFCVLASIQKSKLITGTAQPQITRNNMKDFVIPICKEAEQERIVACIEELFSQLDANVAELKIAKERLKVYRQAVLKEAFANFDGNAEQTISSVCENIVDCPHSTPKWTQRGKLCLRTTNFKPGYLDLSEKNYVSEETFCKRITRLVPKPGDVLFSREGAILGIACIIPDGLEVCMGQRMMLLRPSKDLLNKYLMYYLNSPKARTLIIENIGGTASPHINVGDIKRFTIPVVPLIQQQSIVAEIESRLSVCDSIEKTVDTALQQTEALRQSILKKAFEGGL